MNSIKSRNKKLKIVLAESLTEEQIAEIYKQITTPGNNKAYIQINVLINNSENPLVKKILTEKAQLFSEIMVNCRPQYLFIYDFATTLKGLFDGTKLVEKMIDLQYQLTEVLPIIELLHIDVNRYVERLIRQFDELISEYGSDGHYSHYLRKILDLPTLDRAKVEQILMHANSIGVIKEYTTHYQGSIINPKALQDRMIQLVKQHKSSYALGILEHFTARECNNGVPLIPVIDILSQATYVDDEDDQTVHGFINLVHDNNNIACITPDVIAHILKLQLGIIALVHLKLLNLEQLVNFFIENNIPNISIIEELIKESTDISPLNKFILHFKSADLATRLLKYPDKPGFNIVFLQEIIERYGSTFDLAMITNQKYNDQLKLNYASLKKRYNVVHDKVFNKDPNELEEYVEFARQEQNHQGLPIAIRNLLPNSLPELVPQLADRFKDNPNVKNIPVESRDLLNTKINSLIFQGNKKEIEDLINELIAKKDWFCLNQTYLQKFLQNPYVFIYKTIKNKTYLDMYHEAYKSNYPLIQSAWVSYSYPKNNYNWDSGDLYKNQYNIVVRCVQESTNFNEFVKLMHKLSAAIEIKHNEGGDLKRLFHAILNKHFDINDPSNKEFLELVEERGVLFVTMIRKLDNHDLIEKTNAEDIRIYSEKIRSINAKAKRTIINEEQFINNLNISTNLIRMFVAKQPIQWRSGSPEHRALKQLDTDFALIEDFETIQEHLESAQPKNENLKNFNMSLHGFDFKVLDYLDPYTFKVGADTDCCQRIGGAGEDAAIDSFINPLAGVLVVYKNGNIISQSYFHYVPATNGLILDNVEWNASNARKVNMDENSLSKLYADYAEALKINRPEISYIRCGKSYNKINNRLFGQGKLSDDPRHFAVEEPYSDFDEVDHIDLLQPSEGLSNIRIQASSIAKPNHGILKTSLVRLWLLQKIS